MRTPDFLVVGAARAGTTTLHSYLRQHPELFLPKVKEPCFFVFEGEERNYVKGKFAFAVSRFDEYTKLFARADHSQKIGEMSTPYLYLYEKTIKSIKKYFSDYRKIKIVILLRNPVERAFSQYKWRVRDGWEPLTFEDAIESEKDRIQKNFSFDYFYVDRGFYFNQVKAYLETFESVYIIRLGDFKNDPQATLRNLCSFLGVDENYPFSEEKNQNESSQPKSKFLSRVATSESRLKYKLWYLIPDSLRKKIRNSFSRFNEDKKRRMELSNTTREKLNEIYREDILALQKLISVNLSDWLK